MLCLLSYPGVILYLLFGGPMFFIDSIVICFFVNLFLISSAAL
jgi:hypothetical protein